MKISFSGHEMDLHYSGALYWPKQSMVIVADLHLEKSSHYAQRGFFLPPYDSHETLTRLRSFLDETRAQKLLILGDCFHDPKGYERLSLENRTLFDDLQRHDPIWIRGNHDGDFVPPGMASYSIYETDTLVFRHEPTGAKHEISGHLHPKAIINYKGAMISRRCFIEDTQRMIIPAFGSYTGGLDVTDRAIAQYFQFPIRIHLLGPK